MLLGWISYLLFMLIVIALVVAGYFLFMKEILKLIKAKKIVVNYEQNKSKTPGSEIIVEEKDFIDFIKSFCCIGADGFIDKIINKFRKKPDYKGMMTVPGNRVIIDPFIAGLNKKRLRGNRYEKLIYVFLFLFLIHFVYLALDYELTVKFESVVQKNVDAAYIQNNVQDAVSDTLIVEKPVYSENDGAIGGFMKMFFYSEKQSTVQAIYSDKNGNDTLVTFTLKPEEIKTTTEVWINKKAYKLVQVETTTIYLLNVLLFIVFFLLTILVILLIANLARRYRSFENYIIAGCKKNKDGEFNKKPITITGRIIVEKINPEWGNNIYGMVYFGAAFLVIVVGLRGLGEQIHKIEVLETLNSLTGNILLEPKGVKLGIIFLALIFEFSMLCLLALTKFFEPESESENEEGIGGNPPPEPEPKNSCRFPENFCEELKNCIQNIDKNKIEAFNTLLANIDKEYDKEVGSPLRQELKAIEDSIKNINTAVDTLKTNIEDNITNRQPDNKTILEPVINDVDKIQNTINDLKEIFAPKPPDKTEKTSNNAGKQG